MKVRCPKCNNELTYLNVWSEVFASWKFTVDDDGNEEYDDMEITGSEDINHFRCPHCSHDFEFDEDEAVDFLKGEQKRENNSKNH